MPAKRVTQREYLNWMALSPRTNKWSAFVAYDRDKCNQLLMQEYIEKFDNDSYLPPIDEPYATGETTWHWQLDYVTDVPRLSFENNSNDDTSAEVNMSMAVVGGTQVYLNDAGGTPEVTMISSFDPLDHPELQANRVALKDVKGEVNGAGSVTLDLGDPDVQKYIWEVSGSRIEHERRVAGAFFKRKFREAEPKRRSFKLGTLAYTEQEFLKPAVFKIRTVMEEGAQNISAANFGSGAVELRIAMKDELEGGLPGADWLYPIPNDMPGINSSLMFSHEQLMLNIIGQGTALAFGASAPRFDTVKSEEGFVEVIKVKSGTSGHFRLPPQEHVIPIGDGVRISLGEIRIPIYIDEDERLTVSNVGNGRFRVGMGSSIPSHPVDCTIDGRALNAKVSLALNADCAFTVDLEQRKIVYELQDLKAPMLLSSPDIEGQEWLYRLLLLSEFTRLVKEEARKTAEIFFSNLQAIDAFVLNSLLFNSTDAVQLKSVDTPGDLVSFGSISPRLTTFSISPMEHLMGYGESFSFAVNPAQSSITWSVANLDGSSAGAGTIDASGRYTAPGLSDIPGTYKRVKVTATSGEHVSKALVTVAARAITLNPLVQTCPASTEGSPAQTRKLTANALSGSLSWSVKGDGSVPPVASPDRSNVYSAPLKHDISVTKKTFTVDEVIVTNTATSQTQNSLVVVTHDKQTVKIEVTLEGNQAQFSATFNAQDLPPGSANWGCIPETGAGSIDQQGRYTPDPNSQYQFVIITIRAEMEVIPGAPKFFLGDAFYIQPLPLITLPPKPQPEEPQGFFEQTPGEFQL